jgi:predicted MFS family arabinose efflux permease
MGGQYVVMRLVERFNPLKIFRLGLLISTLVFIIYAIANNYLQLLPVQIMLAIAWSGMFIGALSYLLRKNSEHGTVTGLLYSTIYLSAGLGPFLGGAVAQAWGLVAVMYFGSTLGFLSFLSSRGLSTGKEIEVTASHT